ncbi:carbohydrate-binding module family 14 protein [Streptomyces sp. CAI 127]|uniref:carbohydrate-binding module family 14 protein n=1 Tax=Streptomyces sp. CAI 127 TaxID=1076397 RepID=UPI00158719F1|nr:hypothetical protein [Streptomyces sp. CAI 127]
MKRLALVIGFAVAAALMPASAHADNTSPPRESPTACPSEPTPVKISPGGTLQIVVMLADPDPRVYYICDQGKLYKNQCPPQTQFDLDEHVCDWEWNVNRTNPDHGRGEE